MTVDRRCGRLTARGTECSQYTMSGWNVPPGTPIPSSCRMHLTPDEQASWDAAVARGEELRADALRRYQAAEPACWSWPLPKPLDSSAAMLDDEDMAGTMAILEWQQGRCAICGVGGLELVEDHDHRTGLVRGHLCRSCNTREGLTGGGDSPFSRYRQRHPASMLGVRIRYYDIISGAYASPTPQYDPVRDNPMRGIGL